MPRIELSAPRICEFIAEEAIEAAA